MTQISLVPQQPVTYASQVNNRFHKSQSHYVDISTRLAEAITHAGWRAGSN